METETITAEAPPLDPFGATGPGERHCVYAELAARGPVQRVTLPGGVPGWLVLGQVEARAAMADPRLAKTAGPAGLLGLQVAPDDYEGLRNHLLLRDGAAHSRMRRLVGAAFTRPRIDALSPRIQAIADGLLDDLAAAAEVDLIAAYALPLTMTVISELVGVPNGLRPRFRESAAIKIAGIFADPAAYAEAIHIQAEMARELVALKRREPTDDLLSALVAARDAGDRLSEDELTSMLSLLVIAGHETTVHLIGNAVAALLTHPDQLALLRRRPDLMPRAIEEFLRFDGPVQTALAMKATEPVELGSVTIPAGDIVIPVLLAGNRDPSCTPHADVLDVTREPAPHLAFGHGIHHCLGAPLARLEARIALTSLLARFPQLAFAGSPEDLRRRPNLLTHGFTVLPVRLRDRGKFGHTPTTTTGRRD